MAQKREPQLVQQTFAFDSDAQLNTLIADHRAAHLRDHGQTLAMHTRRELGPGKVLITFRIVEKK